MKFKADQLDRIYEKTGGCCHICHVKLSRSNHGKNGRKGAWHADHSVPRSKGGTDHGNNLRAACVPCNLAKSNRTTRTARRWNGKTRAPLSRENWIEKKNENAALRALAGGIATGLVFGVPGAIIVALVGGVLGDSSNPNEVG